MPIPCDPRGNNREKNKQHDVLYVIPTPINIYLPTV